MANEFLWTISIIAQTDEQHKWEYGNLIDDINKNLHPNLRYVFFDYSQDNKLVKFSEAIENRPLDTNAFINYGPVSSMADVNIKMREFFNDKVFTRTSDYHMVITWGHGSGLSFFSFDNQVSSKTRNFCLQGINEDIETAEYKEQKWKINIKNVHHNMLIANLSTKVKNNNANDRKEPDCIKNDENKKTFNFNTDVLPAEDFADILEKAFGGIGKKVNVLIANSCWMNTFEVGWALRNVVDVYAAPQTVVPFAGFNFDKLFDLLTDMDENYNQQGIPGFPSAPWLIARNLTDNFLLKYGDTIKDAYYQYPQGKGKKYLNFAEHYAVEYPDSDVRQMAISVNFLRDYDKIHKIINELAEYLITKIKEQSRSFMQKIDAARSFCGDFTQEGVSFIDFTNFFCELIKSFQTEDAGPLTDIYRRFFFLKEKSQLSMYSPSELFRFMPGEFYSHSPQMFSIYFPSRTSKSEATTTYLDWYVDSSRRSKFQKESYWDEFLKVYLQK